MANRKNPSGKQLTPVVVVDDDPSQTTPTVSVDKHAKEKTAMFDVGARARSLANLKPGGVSIRTPEMIEAMVRRLCCGESLGSICTDPDMPAYYTVAGWQQRDPELRALIAWGRAEGAQFIFDVRQDIVAGGHFTTGDKERDFELAKVLKDVASKRNPTVFGDKVEVVSKSINYTIEKKDTDW